MMLSVRSQGCRLIAPLDYQPGNAGGSTFTRNDGLWAQLPFKITPFLSISCELNFLPNEVAAIVRRSSSKCSHWRKSPWKPIFWAIRKLGITHCSICLPDLPAHSQADSILLTGLAKVSSELVCLRARPAVFESLLRLLELLDKRRAIVQYHDATLATKASCHSSLVLRDIREHRRISREIFPPIFPFCGFRMHGYTLFVDYQELCRRRDSNPHLLTPT